VNLIVSFPRSGNHLCRFIIEYITGMATQGCLANPKDVPICENVFESNPTILSHVRRCEYVGQKAHSWEEVKEYSNHLSISFSAVLLILRDPINAIVGHILAEKMEDDLDEVLRTFYDSWQQLLIQTVRTPMRKAILNYDDLVSDLPSSYLIALQAITETFWEEVIPNRLFEMISDFDTFRAISASGKKRSWAGLRSVGKSPNFHLEKLNVSQKAFVVSYISNRLAESISKIEEITGTTIDRSGCKFSGTVKVVEQLRQWKKNLGELS